MASQSFEKIKVFTRIRPSKEDEVQKVVHIENNSLTISLNNDPKSFQFDGLFGEDSNQEEVFDGAASRIVHGALQGYNGTIFAYGQTGSGKTHTMIGPSHNFDDESGIIPRGLHLLFDQLDTKRDEMPAGTFSAKITISFVEIHNENIYDLFVMNDEKLKIGQDQDGNAMVKGATEIFVKDLNDAMEEVRRGWNNRTVAETAMNRHSSRSHALLLIKIRTEEVHGDSTTDRISTARSAFLNLVDLAGSERVDQSKVEGERFKETTNINKSLLTLKIVIRELSEQKKKNGFIVFRNSVLTHILKDSLGGNARTAVMINVHPDKMYYSETLSTLQFSAEVRRIENKVVVNEDLKGDSVNAYKAEIRRLQEEIENVQSKSETDLAEMKRSLDAWKEAANRMERQLAVARRNAVNAAIIARKDGQGAAQAESIWEKSMSEVAESARKLPIDNIRSMQLRNLTADLENCTYEKDELQAQLELERKMKTELQERLKKYMEGTMSPVRKARPESASSQDEGSVSSKLGTLGSDGSFVAPSASKKQRRLTRYTPAKDRQSNFFRPVLDVDGDNNAEFNAPPQIDSFEEKELRLELEINTHKQIIDEKTQECERLVRLLEGAEKRVSEAEANFTNSKVSNEEKVKELTAEMEKAKKTIAEENEKFVLLEKRSIDLEGQLMEANGQMDGLQSDMNLLKSTHVDEMEELERKLKCNLSDTEKKEVDLKREMDALKTKLDSTKIELMNKEIEKKAADEVLTLLRDRIVKAEEDKSAKIAEMESLLCQMREVKEAAENEKKEWEEKMKEKDEERRRSENEYKTRLSAMEKDVEMKKKESEQKIKEKEEERRRSEDEYKTRMAEMEKEIEMKKKELKNESKKMNEMGETSCAQLATLQEKMNQLRIEKDNAISEKSAEIQHWSTVSLQFSQKMDEMKAEFSNEKDKRKKAEDNEKRAQEIIRLHISQNDELKENISALGSHNNVKQKQHMLSRYVEEKRLLTLRVTQLEAVMEKHGLTIPKMDHGVGGASEEEGGSGSQRNSDVINTTNENAAPSTRMSTRVVAAPSTSTATSAASSSRASVRTTRVTKK